MRKHAKTLLIAACLLSFLLLLGMFNTSKPRIMVLHSSGEGSPWTEQVDRGMRDALTANRRPVSVTWMYLDVASPDGGRAAKTAQAQARRAIAQEDPDVVIAVDDEANELVARDYVGRTEPRILYVSLDRPPADYGYAGAPNVSGISERMPFAAIKDALGDLLPGRSPSVSAIGVDGITGRAELAQFRAFDWGPSRVAGAQLVSTGQAWRDVVTNAGSDVLVVLGCQDLPDTGGGVFTAAQAARWTQENASALPIGTQVSFVADGGALAFSPPPVFYGYSAIRLALDWLDDRSTPGAPPPVESSHFDVAIRRAALDGRGLRLPPVYIEAARGNDTLF